MKTVQKWRLAVILTGIRMREARSGSEPNYTHIFVYGVEGFFCTKHKYMSPALYNNHIYLTAAGKGLIKFTLSLSAISDSEADGPFFLRQTSKKAEKPGNPAQNGTREQSDSERGMEIMRRMACEMQDIGF